MFFSYKFAKHEKRINKAMRDYAVNFNSQSAKVILNSNDLETNSVSHSD